MVLGDPNKAMVVLLLLFFLVGLHLYVVDLIYVLNLVVHLGVGELGFVWLCY